MSEVVEVDTITQNQEAKSDLTRRYEKPSKKDLSVAFSNIMSARNETDEVKRRSLLAEAASTYAAELDAIPITGIALEPKEEKFDVFFGPVVLAKTVRGEIKDDGKFDVSFVALAKGENQAGGIVADLETVTINPYGEFTITMDIDALTDRVNLTDFVVWKHLGGERWEKTLYNNTNLTEDGIVFGNDPVVTIVENPTTEMKTQRLNTQQMPIEPKTTELTK